MKSIKKYILAIVTCLCMMFCTLTGCALVVPDNSKALEEKAITVGSTVLSKKDVVDLWYSFYNENSSVFYYYSEDQIIEIFYKNVVCQQAILQETYALMSNQVLMYSAKDDASVWQQVLNHISSNVDTYEKALFTQNGVEDKDLPARLQSEDTSSSNSDVKSYLYTEYDFTGMEDYECEYLYSSDKETVTNVGENVTSTQVKDVIALLGSYLYKTPANTSDDKELEFDNYQDLKNSVTSSSSTDFSNIQSKYRSKAFDMYVSKLMLSAKSNGKTHDKATVLFDEVKRLYVSYYENYITNMYKSYVNSLVDNVDSDYYTLSDQAIVSRYLQLVGKDLQNYKLEENYIAVLEAKPTEALLLYHYNGEYYYFTVQHLLVSFDDEVSESLANIYGNQTTASAEQYAVYESIRNNFYSQILNKKESTLENKVYLESWEQYNNATYRDENGYDVYVYNKSGVDYLVYFDSKYVAPETEETEEVAEDDVLNGYYYNDPTADGGKVYLTKGEFDTCKKATVTVGVVLKEFNDTYSETIKVLTAAQGQTAAQVLETLKSNDSVHYLISQDLIEDYLAVKASGTAEQLNVFNHKVYTNLFMQHAFKYSADSASLGTDLSDYVGMIISGQPDNHKVGGSTYVSEFTDKARELANTYIQNLEAGNTLSTTLSSVNYGISDYGIHMIIVNDVFKALESAPITGSDITAENVFGEGMTQAEINIEVAKAVAKMKTIYVSSTSSQTLYEYLYEDLRDELVGDSGTVYTKQRNKLYNDYMNSGKANTDGKMSYDELMDAIS